MESRARRKVSLRRDEVAKELTTHLADVGRPVETVTLSRVRERKSTNMGCAPVASTWSVHDLRNRPPVEQNAGKAQASTKLRLQQSSKNSKDMQYVNKVTEFLVLPMKPCRRLPKLLRRARTSSSEAILSCLLQHIPPRGIIQKKKSTVHVSVLAVLPSRFIQRCSELAS